MMTLEEIGQLLGVTRERVRQIEAKALRKLRPPNFGTEDWMNMDSSEKLEAIMRWRGVCGKTGRLDAGATLFDVNRAKPDRLLLVSDRARI